MAITSEEIHNQSFTVDRKGYDVDFSGDMLEEHIDFIDVVALAVDREALVMNFFGSDSHDSSLTRIEMPI